MRKAYRFGMVSEAGDILSSFRATVTTIPVDGLLQLYNTAWEDVERLQLPRENKDAIQEQLALVFHRRNETFRSSIEIREEENWIIRTDISEMWDLLEEVSRNPVSSARSLDMEYYKILISKRRNFEAEFARKVKYPFAPQMAEDPTGQTRIRPQGTRYTYSEVRMRPRAVRTPFPIFTSGQPPSFDPRFIRPPLIQDMNPSGDTADDSTGETGFKYGQPVSLGYLSRRRRR